MKNKKISFITTVFNEEKTIVPFLDSLFSQTRLPDEIIIVDGGSSDQTINLINKTKARKYKGKFVVAVKKGNRSVGRNEAIKNASGGIIVCSDAGNILDKDWILHIIEPFANSEVDVVAGYYKSKAKTIFQKCLVPFALVMPDKVDENNFLPATRSIAFTKVIWEKVGGFPEEFSHNEDYVFANRLQKIGAKIFFARNAIVYWLPRNNFKDAFVMFFRFALGDAEAGIIRSKVMLLFARYFLGFYFLFLCLLYKSLGGFVIFGLCLFLYIVWAIKKNLPYVEEKKAIIILPLLQLTADAAVICGTAIGLCKLLMQINYLRVIQTNKLLIFIVILYTSILLFTIQWGIPNQQHPFPYHMDEWHQLQAVGNTFRYGTPNTAGSANGTMFHFIVSGFYLLPFTLVNFVDPFSLQIDNAFMRQRIFEILRFQTILFGVLSIIVLYKIADLIGASKKIAIALFTFSPIWLLLSGYFKYDIALLFWLLLSFLFFFRFAKEPSSRNFLLSAIPVGLAIATKVSAIPLLLIYLVSYFWFSNSRKKDIKYFLAGILLSIFIVIFFGMPDTLFGKGNILVYLFENIVATPDTTSNFQLVSPILYYLFSTHFSLMFGDGLMFFFSITLLIWVYAFFKQSIKVSIRKYKVELFLFLSLVIFALSIIKLQIGALGNRTLVLLPFFVLIVSLLFQQVIFARKIKLLSFPLIVIIFIVQVSASFAWMYIKTVPSPQERSSLWIEKNIDRDQIIGIENIPIYQYLPHVIQKEFYFNEYKKGKDNNYRYKIVDNTTVRLPSILVVTNDDIENKLLKQSPKKALLKRLKKDGYKRIAVFTPDFAYLNYFASDIDYYLSGVVTSPVNTSIYKK